MTPWQWLGLALLVGVPLAAGYLVLREWRSRRALEERGIRTQGTVVAVEEVFTQFEYGKVGGRRRSKIRFEDAEGRPHMRDWVIWLEEGERVDLIYDPQKPERVHLTLLDFRERSIDDAVPLLAFTGSLVVGWLLLSQVLP